MEKLNELLDLIIKPDSESALRCKERLDNIAKPIDGLGEFECVLPKLAGIYGDDNFNIDKKAIVVMCADNGVTVEGVSLTGHKTTTAIAEHIVGGTAVVSIMARHTGVSIYTVDIGMYDTINAPGLIHAKISNGTNNIAKGPAMTKAQLLSAIHIGMKMVRKLKDGGYRIIATGEMGIGNTTTSSAVASVLLGISPRETTGRGTGLSPDAFAHKIEVIKKAIDINKPDRSNTIDVVMKIGGFDIAGLIGMFLGGAVYKIPIVIDGVISATAALAASMISKNCVDYMLASHLGKEPANKYIFEKLGLNPVIRANMSLGEGAGAVMLLPMLDLAVEVYRQNTTFEKVNMKRYERSEM
ncbi:MAG: nicotinate-nucleotide--dimethylbenzimidazole phosphoribosyltransferase [Eubacterium sp.]|jgi:nicotinate-nucleotide--dimethylbenzimidazole phosphoribosyltransferase|nr:nicotinate-nucleotide--dimethylbenzimidazole phosphoribosyltransferase [Eubacterium sp.]